MPRYMAMIMDKHTGFMKALKCRECGREYPLAATHVCEFDFGPLEVVYDHERVKRSLTREAILSRPQTMWRYRELLPVATEPTVGLEVGYTPLIRRTGWRGSWGFANCGSRTTRSIIRRCHSRIAW